MGRGAKGGSLVNGRDVALAHEGLEPKDDVDAEKDGDAVVAVAHVGVHVLLQGEGGRRDEMNGGGVPSLGPQLSPKGSRTVGILLSQV